MKVYYLGVLRNDQRPAIELCAEKDLSSWSRFTQSSYGEFMTLFAKTVAERTNPGQRQDIEEQDFVFHVYARTEGIAAVMISEKEYPTIPAHSVLSKVVDDFLVRNPDAGAADTPVSFPELKLQLSSSQNPEEVSSIMKIQRELDETKIVLHKTIESVLERGEKLDDLVDKSEALSRQSKAFYTSAKKQNSCCVVM